MKSSEVISMSESLFDNKKYKIMDNKIKNLDDSYVFLEQVYYKKIQKIKHILLVSQLKKVVGLQILDGELILSLKLRLFMKVLILLLKPVNQYWQLQEDLLFLLDHIINMEK